MVNSAPAAVLEQAKITRIFNEVNVVDPSATPRPANLGEDVKGKTGVQTGQKSRAELLFNDRSLARLGANTIFRFDEGTRNLELGQGVLLLQVPKNAGGAKITTAAVTAAITGTTIMMEYSPGKIAKVIVLEGTLRMYLNNRVGESTLINPGQMMILNPQATTLPKPVNVGLERLVKTSGLVKEKEGEKVLDGNGGGTGKSNLDMKPVDVEVKKQNKKQEERDLIETPLVLSGTGATVTLTDLMQAIQNVTQVVHPVVRLDPAATTP